MLRGAARVGGGIDSASAGCDDLGLAGGQANGAGFGVFECASRLGDAVDTCLELAGNRKVLKRRADIDRKSVVEGKSVSGRVDHGGRRIIKKKNRLNAKYIVKELTTHHNIVNSNV